MLEQLFGTKLRIKVIMLFLTSPEKFYTLAELAKLSNSKVAAVAKELNILDKLNLVSQQADKRWQANGNFILYPELRSLILKGKLLLEKNLIKKIEKIGTLKLLLVTGNFVGLPQIATDILLVGRINRHRLAKLIRKFERELGGTINYTMMTFEEFKYRRDITDKFLYEILENKHLKIIDKL